MASGSQMNPSDAEMRPAVQRIDEQRGHELREASSARSSCSRACANRLWNSASLGVMTIARFNASMPGESRRNRQPVERSRRRRHPAPPTHSMPPPRAPDAHRRTDWCPRRCHPATDAPAPNQEGLERLVQRALGFVAAPGGAQHARQGQAGSRLAVVFGSPRRARPHSGVYAICPVDQTQHAIRFRRNVTAGGALEQRERASAVRPCRSAATARVIDSERKKGRPSAGPSPPPFGTRRSPRRTGRETAARSPVCR